MLNKVWNIRAVMAAVLIASFWVASMPVAAQDLVAVSSISGSSSIFVFRGSSRSAPRRTVARPTRTKEQRLASTVKIKKQYETLAKNGPRTNRAKIVDPNKLPPNAGKSLPPAQASKLFAGVGEYYVDKGEYDQSFDFFRDAIRLDDKNETAKVGLSEALALKGNDLLVKDQADTAKGLFLEAIKYNPKNSPAYFGLGEIYSSSSEGQVDAVAAYEKALANDKDLTEIYVPLGILYYQSGDIAKADNLLSKALVSSPGNAETQFFLGLIRTSQNRTDEALAAFQKAEKLDPTYADAYFNEAELLVKLNRANDAIPEYRTAISLKPGNFDALLGLAQALLATGKYKEAIDAFNAAKKVKNDNWEVNMGLGDAYRQTDDFNNAVGAYNLAALFYTRQKDFNKETAADIYSKQGFVIGQQCPLNQAKFAPCHWNDAVKLMEKAVELGGGTPLDQGNLGWAYYNAARTDLDNKDTAGGKAKLDLAKTALLKALSGSPAVVEGALQNLGAVQIDQGDYNGAIDSLNKVVDKHPDWLFSRYALGTAYFKVNDFNNAEKWFRAVVDKDSNYVPALASLGYTEIKLKKGGEVKKIIDRLKTLSPGDAQKLDKEMKVARL